MISPEKARDLIAQVANEHGKLITPNDPVFLFLALNQLVVGDVIAEFEARLAAVLDQLAAAQAGHVSRSQEIASTIIHRAAAEAADRSSKLSDQVGLDVRKYVAAQLAAARDAAADAQSARTSTYYAMAAAIGAASFVLGLIFARLI